MGVSGNLWSCQKEVKPLVVYAVEGRMVLEPIQGNQVSAPVDFWYTELFRIPAVISVSF